MRIGGVYKEYGRNEYVHKKTPSSKELGVLLGYPDSNQE